MLIITVTYNRIERTVDSVHSVIKDLHKSKKNHRLVVVDNCSKDGTAKCLAMMQARNRCFDELILNNFNFGKAQAVNNVVNKLFHEETIVCSFDGDLVVDSNFNGDSFFDLMEDAYVCANHDEEFAVLCANLTGDSAHNMRLLRAIVSMPFGNVLYNPKGGSGVAGGCLTVGRDIFISVGGYRTNHGIYGGNDGFLIADMVAKYPDCKIGMVESLSVYHPYEQDEGYENYKKEAVGKIRATGFGEQRGYYD